MKITDPILKAAQPKDKAYTISDGEGLALHVQPNGAKWWRFRYRFNGKAGLLSLGVYPDVTLKAARLERDRLQDLLKQGVNPSQNRQEEKLTAKIAKEGRAPQPVRLGIRCTMYPNRELHRWLADPVNYRAA